MAVDVSVNADDLRLVIRQQAQEMADYRGSVAALARTVNELDAELTQLKAVQEVPAPPKPKK